ncbi:hypothetical protein P879_10604 [Paragonimus westermani]|uniref:Peptidase A2 domain-containing protein n=1 Tax=Paragonimus westermani TaxID=34504 RepID=A0A8T0D205_9TREM|nr:hypothetical protein P879_10604 [Paragonimus westermani]
MCPRNRGLRNKFTLRPTENLSVALIKAKGCEALEQLDEKRATEQPICLACPQSRTHTFAKPTSCPESVINTKPLSVRGSINKEAVLFLVDTGASRSLIRAQLAVRLTKHLRALKQPVRLLAVNGMKMWVTSLSASAQLGSLSGEYQFLACPNLQREVILGMDFLGRFEGVLNFKGSQMNIGSCVVDLERGRPKSLSMPDHMRNLRENLRTAFSMTQGHMEDAQRRQKEQHDQHVSGLVYQLAVERGCVAQKQVSVGRRSFKASGKECRKLLLCARQQITPVEAVSVRYRICRPCIIINSNQPSQQVKVKPVA